MNGSQAASDKGPVALPVQAKLEGEAQVTLRRDAVWVQSANEVRLGF